MNLLKETMINPVEEKSLMSILNGISPTDKLKDSLHKAKNLGKEAMERFINFCLVTLETRIYDPIKKLKLEAFSNMTKRVTVKLRVRGV